MKTIYWKQNVPTTLNVPIGIKLMRGTTLTLWVGHNIGIINPINGTILKGQ